MRLLARAALLVALAMAAGRSSDDDDDSDPAPFMMVLEHRERWRCAASLVSIRTGVTTARCARGPMSSGDAEAREIWALAAARPPAPPSAGARLVARVALAGAGRDPADPALDMAVVELEAPFGGAALARPILMATSVGGCEEASVCHAVRAVAGDDRRREVFRVSNLSFAADGRCAARVPHWAASRDRLFCFAGDELCDRDLGGGVVCGGKLCGVLSAVGPAGDAGATCGDTLAAQAVARWRRFLHCAHTLRQCGRGACAELCTERRLLGPRRQQQLSTPTAYQPPRSEYTTIGATVRSTGEGGRADGGGPTRSPPRPSRTRSQPTPSSFVFFDEERAQSPRPALEFEPNRADFRAGEYGDNAADYGGEEAPLARAPPSSTAAPSRSSPPAAPAPPPPPAPALRLATPAPASSSARALRSQLFLPCLSLLL